MLGLMLSIAAILPIVVLLIIEVSWKLKGFPRLLVANLSCVPSAVLIYKGYLIYFYGDQYYGLILLFILGFTATLVNSVKSFIPS